MYNEFLDSHASASYCITNMIAPGIFSNAPSTKLNIFERDWSSFDQENSICRLGQFN